MTSELAARKEKLRDLARDRRRAQRDKDALSREIVARVMGTPEYREAKTVLFYMNVRTEVRTRPALASALASGKRIVVPYCVENRLGLFHLRSTGELSKGTFGILEPNAESRDAAVRRIHPTELDLILVPGLAFDGSGGRLGYGKGYYDRLLATARADAEFVGVGFECQVFPVVPIGPDDILMNQIVTEVRTRKV